MVKRQPIEAYDYPMKLMVTNITDIIPMVTNIYLIVTDVYPMVAEESSIANPPKIAKIDENIRKMQKSKKMIGNTAFAEELPNSSVLLVKLVVIGASTDYSVLSVASVMYPIHFRSPTAKLSSLTR